MYLCGASLLTVVNKQAGTRRPGMGAKVAALLEEQERNGDSEGELELSSCCRESSSRFTSLGQRGNRCKLRMRKTQAETQMQAWRERDRGKGGGQVSPSLRG